MKSDKRLRAAVANYKSGRRNPKVTPWIILTVFISALTVSYYHWTRYENQSAVHESIITNEYKKPKKRIPSTNQSALSVAINYYENDEIDRCETLLKAMEVKSDSAYYYLAHIAFEKMELSKANSYLKKIKAEGLKMPLSGYLHKIANQD